MKLNLLDYFLLEIKRNPFKLYFHEIEINIIIVSAASIFWNDVVVVVVAVAAVVTE